MIRFNWYNPRIGYGCYLIPTIQVWRTDFTKENILPYVSWGFILKIFIWDLGFTIDVK